MDYFRDCFLDLVGLAENTGSIGFGAEGVIDTGSHIPLRTKLLQHISVITLLIPFIPITIVDILCNSADVVGFITPATPSKINPELIPTILL